MDRPYQPGGRVASPDLEGEQVAILQPHAASAEPHNKRSLLMSEACVCAPGHKARQSTKNAPNFLELRKAEVGLRRIPLPRTPVNKPR